MALLEVSPYETDAGHMIGRDPRRLTPTDFSEAGIPLMSPRKAIRAKCLDCCGGSQSEVAKCVQVDCTLWPMRMGGLSRALRAAIRKPAAGSTDDTATHSDDDDQDDGE